MPNPTISPHPGNSMASTTRHKSQESKRPAGRVQHPTAGGGEGGQNRLSLGGTKAFEVRCESRDQRDRLIRTTELSAVVAQRIRRNNFEEMWDSVIIRCTEEEDGTMAVRILVTNPDWHELIQIAYIRSRPYDEDSLTALGCNLDHVSERRAE